MEELNNYYRRIKISRKFKGDEYLFYLYLNRETFNCSVRRFMKDDFLEAEIQSDLKTVKLKTPILITSLNGKIEKYINKLTIPKNYLYVINDLFRDEEEN